MGLHLDYTPLRSSILSSDPLPTLDRAYHLILQDERVRSTSLTYEPLPLTAVLGFPAQSTGVGRGGSRAPYLFSL